MRNTHAHKRLSRNYFFTLFTERHPLQLARNNIFEDWLSIYISSLQEKSVETLCTVSTQKVDLNVDMKAFMSAQPSASFGAWKENSQSKRKIFNSYTIGFKRI